jgi:hypothetical protein
MTLKKLHIIIAVMLISGTTLHRNLAQQAPEIKSPTLAGIMAFVNNPQNFTPDMKSEWLVALPIINKLVNHEGSNITETTQALNALSKRAQAATNTKAKTLYTSIYHLFATVSISDEEGQQLYNLFTQQANRSGISGLDHLAARTRISTKMHKKAKVQAHRKEQIKQKKLK